MRSGPGDHPKLNDSDRNAARLVAEWQYFRVAMENLVTTALTLLDTMEQGDGHESDGDESEDDEGQYPRSGQMLLSGATEDDEPDDI